MLKVGLLGAGRIGQVHAGNIAGHRDSVLAAVSDVNTTAAEALAAEHGSVACPTEEILAAYPYLEGDDVRAALAYAAWRVDEHDLPLRAS